MNLTLDAIADGADLGSLSRAHAAALLLRLAAVQTRLAVTMADNAETSHASAPEMLDAPALAQRLGVTESWVRGAQRAGKIPCTKIGRYRRFDPVLVAAVLSQKA